MIRPLAMIVCALGTAYAVPAGARAADALALVGMSLQGDTPSASDLAAAVRRGFTAGGFQVGNKPLDPNASSCWQKDCLAPLATKYKADLLAWVQIQSSPQHYDVQVRVVSAATAETLTEDHIKCAADDLCPPMPQTVQRLAKEAARKVRARLNDVPPAVVEPAVLATPTPPVASQMPPVFAPPRIYDTSVAEAKSEPPIGALWLAGGSIVALGVSGVLFAYNNVEVACSKDKLENCMERNDFSGYAWGVGIAGLLGLGAATAWWLSGTAEPAAQTLGMAPWASKDSAGMSLSSRFH